MLWWTLRKLRSPSAAARLAAVRELGRVRDRRGLMSLIGARCFDPDESVRRAALDSLAARERPADRQEVVKLLRHDQPFMRATAAELVSTWGGEGALRLILSLLHDSAETTRIAAIEALWRLADPEAIPHLVPLLGEPDTVRQAAVRALHGIDPHWLRREDARGLVLRDQGIGRLARIDLLAGLGGAAAEPMMGLLEECRRGDTWAPEAEIAAAVLGRIGDRRAVPLLCSALESNLSVVRHAAAEALGRIRDPAAVAPLIAAMGGSFDDARRAAASALDALGWRPSDPTEHALREVASGNMAAAARRGEPGVRALAAVAAEDLRTAGVRESPALHALGQTGHVTAVPPLVEALKNKALREEAQRALIALGSVAAGPLQEILRSDESDVSWNEWFGDMPDQVSLRDLIRGVLDALPPDG